MWESYLRMLDEGIHDGYGPLYLTMALVALTTVVCTGMLWTNWDASDTAAGA